MTEPTIAFLEQPARFLSEAKRAVAQSAIETLQTWSAARKPAGRGQPLRRLSKVHQLPVLDTDFVMLVLQDAAPHLDLQVCQISRGAPGPLLLDACRNLARAQKVATTLEVGLDRLDVAMFEALQLSVFPTLLHHHGHMELAPDRFTIRTLKILDRGRTWQASHARAHFKDLLNDAAREPQIVNRDDGDVVVVAKSYLEELVQPTGARATMQWFAERALSEDGMLSTSSRPAAPLEPLPELS